MANADYNWENKEYRKIIAKKHIELMQISYKDSINYSIKNTTIEDNSTNYQRVNILNKYKNDIQVLDLDSVSAIQKFSEPNKKTAILNFASFKYPGGGFLAGSRAQEECLCHASTLYNVISNFEDFYEYNRNHLNNALYLNRGLYSPEIQFGDIACDVITVAAPNKGTAQRYCNITNRRNYDILYDRINFIINIAKNHNVNNLILGAFGCGVFRQDPKEVASIFKEILNYTSCFDKIIFAIPKFPDEENYKTFLKIFKKDKIYQ